MHKILIFNLIIAVFLCFSCHPSNLLHAKYHPFYHEKNLLLRENPIVLEQSVQYDEPHVIDEAFSHNLSIRFPDLDKALQQKVLDLEKDTALVQCSYGIFSVWSWGDNERNKISGKIEICRFHNKRLTLKESVVVEDYRQNDTLRFYGRRTFRVEE